LLAFNESPNVFSSVIESVGRVMSRKPDKREDRGVTDTDWGDMAGAGFEHFRINSLDRVLLLIGEPDLNQQLIAIKGLLHRNREAEKQVAEEIKALDAHIRAYAGGDEEYQMHMQGQWVDSLHGTVFQDAAHSMSAVGMLAPFIESLFVSIFQELRQRLEANEVSFDETPRGPSSTTKFWDPRWVREDERWKLGLVRGARQLSDAIGLSPCLPEGFAAMHAALVAYRNSMFHNGFEWPLDERQKFASQIENNGWPNHWFTQAKRDNEPWVFYMSDDFIEHCLQIIDQVLEGVGRYLEQNGTGRI